MARGQDSDAGRSAGMAAALRRLRAFNEDTRELTEQDAAQAEEMEYHKFKERERLEEERRCPSYKRIPRFYQPRGRSTRPTRNEGCSLLGKVEMEARRRMVHRKRNEELLEESDLHVIIGLLKKRAVRGTSSGGGAFNEEVIDYDAFYRIREELLQRGERFKPFFSASTFLKFPRDDSGCICVDHFFTFVVKKAHAKHTRAQLSLYDTQGRGYLTETDMEIFIFELIPTMPQLNELQEELHPFYVFTAVRKFFFFLDPKRTGRLHIRDLVSAHELFELYELRTTHSDPSEVALNWFSMQSALKVYGAYLALDLDHNGMLNKAELRRFGKGMVTDAFMDRVFEEYQTYRDPDTGEREMDYKNFIEFVLAMEHINTKQGIQYFWKLVDIDRRGWIDSHVIGYFYGDVARTLRSMQTKLSVGDILDVPKTDDVKDEIFDMVKPETPGRITFEDLKRCGQGGTILQMLTDAAAFWRYDNRETLLIGPDHEEDDEDDDTDY